MKLLHYSNDSGSIEYVVLSYAANFDGQESHCRPGCSLDGIYDVTEQPRGVYGRQPVDLLPVDQPLMRS